MKQFFFLLLHASKKTQEFFAKRFNPHKCFCTFKRLDCDWGLGVREFTFQALVFFFCLVKWFCGSHFNGKSALDKWGSGVLCLRQAHPLFSCPLCDEPSRTWCLKTRLFPNLCHVPQKWSERNAKHTDSLTFRPKLTDSCLWPQAVS